MNVKTIQEKRVTRFSHMLKNKIGRINDKNKNPRKKIESPTTKNSAAIPGVACQWTKQEVQ